MTANFQLRTQNIQSIWKYYVLLTISQTFQYPNLHIIGQITELKSDKGLGKNASNISVGDHGGSSLVKVKHTHFTNDNQNVAEILHGGCKFTLRWRHNGYDDVSNHQLHHCLPNRLVRRRSKKTLKLRVTGLCAGNSPVTGEFPAQMASKAENVSSWWRYHVGWFDPREPSELTGHGNFHMKPGDMNCITMIINSRASWMARLEPVLEQMFPHETLTV